MSAYITFPTDENLAEVVAQHRANSAALRRLRATPKGWRSTATLRAIARRVDAREEAESRLERLGYGHLVGDLVELDSLTARIADSKKMGMTRPELRSRLTKVRASIRKTLV